jgi:site-specific DNA-methyltransferase (adenine-specific)
MARHKSGSAQLVFADPPSNIGINYDGRDDRMTQAAYQAWCRSWIIAAVRLLAPTGSMWVLVNHEESPHMRLALEAAGLHHRQTITWHERFGVHCPRKFNRCCRPLLWTVRNPTHFAFNADAVRTRNARLAVSQGTRANARGKILDDLWSIAHVAGARGERIKGFPTQLPIRLLRRVVGCASNPGDLVVDPFSGSATTGAACIELGRRYLGIEKSDDYAERSRQRLASTKPCLMAV